SGAHPPRHPRRRTLDRDGSGPAGGRHHRRLGGHRTALHASRHRTDAGRRCRHARPGEGAERTARAHRVRAGDRIPRRPGAPRRRPETARGGRLMPHWLRALLASGPGRFGVIVVLLIALTAVVSLFWT